MNIRPATVAGFALALLSGACHIAPGLAAEAAMLQLSLPWGGVAQAQQDRRLHAALLAGDVAPDGSSTSPRVIALDLTALADRYRAAQADAQRSELSTGGRIAVGVGIAAAVVVGAYVYLLSRLDDGISDGVNDALNPDDGK